MNYTETMQRVIEKCDILYNGEIISREELMKNFVHFLSKTIDNEKHNVGLVMHTGSICFDVVILTYASITNLVSNETTSQDIISSLEIGDYVLYSNERYVFEGIVDGKTINRDLAGKKYAKLNQKDHINFVPEKLWRKIEPYNGESKRLDGRGIKKKSTMREAFYKEVLEYPESEIPQLIDTSSVLVISRDRANELIKGISLRFNNKTISLLDLITASYFTEVDEYRYGGNTGKNEPVIKLCGKISVARKLLLSRNGNNHIGLIVTGHENIERGGTELPELINRKSLQYVYVLTRADLQYGKSLLEEDENVELFACTKEFLNTEPLNFVQERNCYTEELERQINTIINKDIIAENIQGFPVDWKTYKMFKNMMLKIKRLEYESEAKDNFIIHAHSLMNLYMTSIFSMKCIFDAKEREWVSVNTTQEKLDMLEEIIINLPHVLKEPATDVFKILKTTDEALVESTPKEVWLRSFLYKHQNSKMAIIVPKAYYANVLEASGWFSSIAFKKVVITTAGKFDSSKMYEVIIVVGNIEGKKFNAFKTNSSSKIINLLYDAEIKGFEYQKRQEERERDLYNSRSTIKLNNIKPIEELETPEEDFVEQIDTEINEYIYQRDTFVSAGQISRLVEGNRSHLTTEIVAMVTFEDDRKAFLSKHYKAYVFDSNEGLVKEVGALDLCSGDSIVFTKNNNDTQDIVDSMLRQLIEANKLTSDLITAYEKSQRWKTSFRKFVISKKYSMFRIMMEMKKLGVPVQEVTIMRWLDEDAHIVGPRDVESIAVIGKLIGDEEMSRHPDVYSEACKEVRSLRRKILGQIGETVINKLSGKRPEKGSDLDVIYDKIDDLSEILQIERIVLTEREIPLGLANRPINVRGE